MAVTIPTIPTTSSPYSPLVAPTDPIGLISDSPLMKKVLDAEMPSGANIFGWLNSGGERSLTWTERLDDDDWWLDLHFTDANTPIVRAWNYDHGDWYDNRGLPQVVRASSGFPTTSGITFQRYAGQLRSFYNRGIQIYNPLTEGRMSLLFIRLPVQINLARSGVVLSAPAGVYYLWGCLIQEGESLDDWYMLCVMSKSLSSSAIRARTVRLDPKIRTTGYWRDADNNLYLTLSMSKGLADALFRSTYNRSVDLMSMENYLKYSSIIGYSDGAVVNVAPVTEAPVVNVDVAAPNVTNEVKVDGGGGGVGRSTGAIPSIGGPIFDTDPITGDWVEVSPAHDEFGVHAIQRALFERDLSGVPVLTGYPPLPGASLIGQQIPKIGVWGQMIGKSDGWKNVGAWWSSTPDWAKKTALGITLAAAASDISARVLETDIAQRLRGQEEYGIRVGNERFGLKVAPIPWTHQLVRLWGTAEGAAPIARNPVGAYNVANALLDGFEGYENGTYVMNVGTFQDGLNADGYAFLADVIASHGTNEQRAALMSATGIGALGATGISAAALTGIASSDDPRAAAAQAAGIVGVESLGTPPSKPTQDKKGSRPPVPPIVRPSFGGSVTGKVETPPEVPDRDILRELEEEGVDTQCVDLARDALEKGMSITYDTFRDKECFEAWQRIQRR